MQRDRGPARRPHWETDAVPRYDPAPLFWSAMWWIETVIATGFAAPLWPAHFAVGLTVAAAVFVVAGIFSYWRVNRSDRMKARRELFAVLRLMPPAEGWIHRDEHLVFARIVAGFPGFRPVAIFQGDENDIATSAMTAVTHTAVHQFTAYPFNDRIYQDVHPVTMTQGEGGESAAAIAKSDASRLRQFRRRAQMERKGFAYMTPAEVRALAVLLRHAEPLGPR